MHRIRLFLALAACLLCASVQAQWQWLDKDGHKVFSDRAPPPDIPAKNILRQPSGTSRTVLPAAAPGAAASTAGATTSPDAAGPKISGIDKDLTERKKQAEAELAAKARAEQERQQKVKSENCERAKANKAVMDSGVRVSQTNAKGEREILDDAGRAAENKRIQQAVDANCK